MNAYAWREQGPNEPKSETALFIEDALERARAVALLDVEPVLPRLPSPSMVASRSPAPPPIANLRAFAETTKGPVRARAPAGERLAPARAPAEPSAKTATRKERPARWPVRLCALVALGFAVASFLASPLGQRPEVREITSSARADAARSVAFVRAQFE